MSKSEEIRGLYFSEVFTLRDWFAGQAMQGLLASCRDYKGFTTKRAAENAYAVADGMLAEREKGGSK